jgi:uncharacterized phiE125 gp8 family phage protein
MKWTQSALVSDYAAAAYGLMPQHLVLAGDAAYVRELTAAAAEYAEEALGASLITRTITAEFYEGEKLFLPRGPVMTVTSVTDAGGRAVGWRLERYGRSDLLVTTAAYTTPLTVVYTAGYGSGITNVPADIRHAIRTHVATLYENRESVSDKAKMPVPHSLADFYRMKSRIVGIG